jgi:hypothetical protein
MLVKVSVQRGQCVPYVSISCNATAGPIYYFLLRLSTRRTAFLFAVVARSDRLAIVVTPICSVKMQAL